jgi:CHAD domain-containing protein
VAKPLPVAGLDPDKRLRTNARRILIVRIGEVYAYDGLVLDPANVTELHDMRIACKRLRYLLEIFGCAFRADLEPLLEEVKGLQDLLGEIHDCDVQVPMLEEHLGWLSEQEARAAQRLVTAGARRSQSRTRDPDADYRRFQRAFAASRRSGERPGIHALIARRRSERVELYERFLVEWRRLRAERFRARLEAALAR